MFYSSHPLHNNDFTTYPPVVIVPFEQNPQVFAKNNFAPVAPPKNLPPSDLQIDEFLLETLRDPKGRMMILKLDYEIERFMRSKSLQLTLPPMTSYRRLIVHRVAQYFKLQHTAVELEGGHRGLILSKTEESRVPLLRLNDLLEKPDAPTVPVKIMKRRQLADEAEKSKRQRSDKKGVSKKTIEEREEAYAKARARIFSESNKSKSYSDPNKESTYRSMDNKHSPPRQDNNSRTTKKNYGNVSPSNKGQSKEFSLKKSPPKAHKKKLRENASRLSATGGSWFPPSSTMSSIQTLNGAAQQPQQPQQHPSRDYYPPYDPVVDVHDPYFPSYPNQQQKFLFTPQKLNSDNNHPPITPGFSGNYPYGGDMRNPVDYEVPYDASKRHNSNEFYGSSKHGYHNVHPSPYEPFDPLDNRSVYPVSDSTSNKPRDNKLVWSTHASPKVYPKKAYQHSYLHNKDNKTSHKTNSSSNKFYGSYHNKNTFSANNTKDNNQNKADIDNYHNKNIIINNDTRLQTNNPYAPNSNIILVHKNDNTDNHNNGNNNGHNSNKNGNSDNYESTDAAQKHSNEGATVKDDNNDTNGDDNHTVVHHNANDSDGNASADDPNEENVTDNNSSDNENDADENNTESNNISSVSDNTGGTIDADVENTGNDNIDSTNNIDNSPDTRNINDRTISDSENNDNNREGSNNINNTNTISKDDDKKSCFGQSGGVKEKNKGGGTYNRKPLRHASYPGASLNSWVDHSPPSLSNSLPHLSSSQISQQQSHGGLGTQQQQTQHGVGQGVSTKNHYSGYYVDHSPSTQPPLTWSPNLAPFHPYSGSSSNQPGLEMPVLSSSSSPYLRSFSNDQLRSSDPPALLPHYGRPPPKSKQLFDPNAPSTSQSSSSGSASTTPSASSSTTNTPGQPTSAGAGTGYGRGQVFEGKKSSVGEGSSGYMEGVGEAYNRPRHQVNSYHPSHLSHLSFPPSRSSPRYSLQSPHFLSNPYSPHSIPLPSQQLPPSSSSSSPFLPHHPNLLSHHLHSHPFSLTPSAPPFIGKDYVNNSTNNQNNSSVKNEETQKHVELPHILEVYNIQPPENPGDTNKQLQQLSQDELNSILEPIVQSGGTIKPIGKVVLAVFKNATSAKKALRELHSSFFKLRFWNAELTLAPVPNNNNNSFYHHPVSLFSSWYLLSLSSPTFPRYLIFLIFVLIIR